jgi:hypothetical protein
MHTPFHPFFWLSSLTVAPSAVAISPSGASCGKHRSQILEFLRAGADTKFPRHKIFVSKIADTVLAAYPTPPPQVLRLDLGLLRLDA